MRKLIRTKTGILFLVFIEFFVVDFLFQNDFRDVRANDLNDISADEIVKRADEIRFPTEPFKIKTQMVTMKALEKDSLLFMNIYSKGTKKVIAHFIAPIREKDKAVLMVENNMWIYMPNIKKSIKISPRQRLVGTQFSNGDVVRISLASDYHAKMLGVVKINEVEMYHLELIAKDLKTSYNKILYWVKKDDYFPVKEEFYSVSGRLLKTLYFTKFKEMAGKIRPYELKMVDGLNNDNISIMRFIDIEIIKLSDKFFTRSNIEKIRK